MASLPELQTFRLVSADNPDCGDSPYDDNHPLNIDGVVELMEGFVAHWGLNHFLLVGGSMGGLVALLYAKRNPDKIAGFVNVEGNLAPEDCMFSRSVVPHSYSHFEKVVFPQIKKALAVKTGLGFARHLRVREKANPRAYYDYPFQTVEYSDHGNLLDRFLSLPAPKCFLYGSQNRHLSYLQRLRESECIVIELPHANHFLFYDQPNRNAAALACQSSCSFPNPGSQSPDWRLQHSPKEKSKMKQSIKRSSLALVALILLALAGTPPYSQGQTQNQAEESVRSRADETLEWWNQIGNKLIAMAKDFPEDKYDFKVQQDQRTFAKNLLHVAAVDYDLIGRVSGSNLGPDFGKDKHNPSRDLYKTKADVVKLLEQAVADGASVIKQQGDAGLDKTTQFGWETGKHVVHNSYIWITAIEHSTEHFGQLVVYYRANNLVPPESRR